MKPPHFLTAAIITALILACLAAPAAALEGSGTEADPYQISTAAELQSIANNLAAYYILTADIDCSGVSWTAIGTQSTPFIGSLDGNGHQIKNLAITGANRGMFGIAGPGAVFKNIQFVGCTVSSTSSMTGMLCGAVIMSASLHTQCQIINVDTAGCSVISSSDTVGGIVGLINSLADVYIVNCDVAGGNVESSSKNNVGGIVGVVYDASSVEIESVTLKNMYIKATMSVAGGIVGIVNGASSAYVHDMQVENCVIESSSSDSAGGIVGATVGASSGTCENGVVENCVVKPATNCAGGVCGFVLDNANLAVSNVDVMDCTIYAPSNYAGGIAGRISTLCTGIFADCAVSDCTIMANTYAAGVCPAYN